MAAGITELQASDSGVGALQASIAHAIEVATLAVRYAVDALGSDNPKLYASVHTCEEELDSLDRDIDERVSVIVLAASAPEVREILACMKLMTDLERVGDLVDSLASRGSAIGTQLDMRDTADLIKMASVLEQMLKRVLRAFVNRDLDAAVDVLSADAEIDRLRNLLYVRLVEGHEGVTPQGVHVLFMAQALERAGDHVKNLAEEICHVLSGHTLRHVLRSHDEPIEQMFLRWLKHQHGIAITQSD